MMKLPGGNFLIGTDDQEGFPTEGEGPVRNSMLNSCYVDTTTVTNEQFAAFINASGYQPKQKNMADLLSFMVKWVNNVKNCASKNDRVV